MAESSGDAIAVLEALLRRGEYLGFIAQLQMTSFESSAFIELDGVILDHDALVRLAGPASGKDALCSLGEELWAVDGGELAALNVFSAAANMGSVVATARLGEALHWLGDDRRAIDLLQAAIANPETESLWLEGLLGEALHAEARDEEAESYLFRAFADYAEFGLPLAEVLLRRGDRATAQAVLEETRELGVYGVAIKLGNLYEELGCGLQAAEAYVRGIAEGDAHSAFNLGLLRHAEGDLDAAQASFALARRMGDLTEPPQDYGDD